MQILKCSKYFLLVGSGVVAAKTSVIILVLIQISNSLVGCGVVALDLKIGFLICAIYFMRFTCWFRSGCYEIK
jgi:predicted permease